MEGTGLGSAHGLVVHADVHGVTHHQTVTTMVSYNSYMTPVGTKST